MASHYFCFKCRDAGFPSEEVIFGGKNSAGKTIIMNPDKSLHQHKENQQQQQQQQQVKSVQGKDENVKSDKTDSQFAEISRQLQGLTDKIEHLSELIYALTEEQSRNHDNNDGTLLDNR